ncbi:MAG: hypothetical protein POELPBGB_03332 [Bacteroidia bacterium]|nr:hypothetical protein [Bacteroidia bacterium]
MAEVEFIDFTYKDTIIEGYNCSWLKVKYPPHEGYVCWPFVSNKIKKDNWSFPLKSPQLQYEGRLSWNCADFIFYNPDLNWYGVYEENNDILVNKIELNLSLALENNTEEMDLENDYLALSTNQQKKSMFIIGLSYLIADFKTWKIYGPTNSIANGNTEDKIIYPGETYNIGYCDKEDKSYDLYAIGSVSEKLSEHSFKIENYQIKINEKIDEKIIRSQNILSDLEFLGEGEKPQLKFIGDLDGDDKPDLITYAGYTSHIQYTLFLSSFGDETSIVKKVAIYNGGNCH